MPTTKASSPAAGDLQTEWQLFLAVRDEELPGDRKDIQALLRAGTLDVPGSKESDTLDQTVRKVQEHRSRLNTLAHQATEARITPAQFAAAYMEKGKDALKVLAKDGDRKYVRRGWNRIVTRHPELGLPALGDLTPHVGLEGPWPPAAKQILDEGIRQVYSNPESSTAGTFEDRLREELGILDAAGLKVFRLLDGLNGKQGCRLLAQSIPLRVLPPWLVDAGHLEIARAILDDRGLRDAVIKAQQDLMLSHEGKESLPNCFVGVVRARRFEEDFFQSFRGLMVLVEVLNKDYIKVRGPHVVWIRDWISDVNKRIAEKDSDYDLKKAEAFQHPELWDAIGQRFEEKLMDLMAHPDPGSLTWRTDFRNALFGVLIHKHPMRVEQFVRMRLKQHYKRDTNRIQFTRKETKNKKPIDIKIPDDGTREAIAFYLDTVRPAMLAGAHSDNFFVPDHARPNAGERLGEKAFNKIMEDMSREWLDDLLPDDMKVLNPHIMRHLAASYQILIEENPGRAAQMLNDELETVLKFYADVLPRAADDLQAYHESRRHGRPGLPPHPGEEAR